MTTTLQPDPKLDLSLRPVNFGEFVGQAGATRALTIFSKAAQQRGQPLGHCLLSGPAGTGKTTLAHILAAESGRRLLIVNAASLETPEDFVNAVLSLQDNDVVFIDEIHCLARGSMQEMMYHVMEEGRLDCIYKGQHISLNMPPMTLIGATTREGKLSKPLLDRFEIQQHLEFYQPDELGEIIKRSAVKLHITVADDAVEAIAKRARGTPRIANCLLKRSRDYADVEGNGNGIVELTEVNATMAMLGIDSFGMDGLDRSILLVLEKSTRPIGLKALSSSLQEDVENIEVRHEPFLLHCGFVARMSNGRIITEAGRKALNI